MLGLFGAVGKLGNEIRDLEKDRTERRNTVAFIGKKAAFYLTSTVMSATFCIFAVFVVLKPGFFWLLPFVPFGLLLVLSVVKAMKDPESKIKFVDAINTRAILLAAAMLIVYAFLRIASIGGYKGLPDSS
ncbi:MAG: hypothetical protein WCF90_05535 [Methanomicrobiales archaeon]